MGDTTESPDSRKQYSRRVRTPKKFFDIDTTEEDNVNTSQDKKGKPKKTSKLDDKSAHEDDEETRSRNDGKDVEGDYKKSRKKSTKAGRRSTKNDAEGENEHAKTVEKDDLISADPPKTNEDASATSLDKQTDDTINKSKDAGQTHKATTEVKEALVRKVKGKGKPRRSSVGSNDSKKCNQNIEQDEERIVADAEAVKIVKQIVDSLRNGLKAKYFKKSIYSDQEKVISDKTESKALAVSTVTPVDSVAESESHENKNPEHDHKKSRAKRKENIEPDTHESVRNDKKKPSNNIDIQEVNNLSLPGAKTKGPRKRQSVVLNSPITCSPIACETSAVKVPQSGRKKKNNNLDSSVTMETSKFEENNDILDSSVTMENNPIAGETSEKNVPRPGRKKKNHNMDSSVTMETSKLDEPVIEPNPVKKNTAILDSSVTMETSFIACETSEKNVSKSGRKRRNNNLDSSVTMETSKLDESVTEPKSGIMTHIDILDSSVTMETSHIGCETSAVNVPRSGRKKKNYNLDSSVTLETSKVDDSATKSRSVGKKKSDALDNNVTMETSKLDDSITEANNSVTMETSQLDESITVPKSGRKRKKVVLDSSVVQETSELDNSMNLSRSGRKRKVVNYSALEKDRDEADDDTVETSKLDDSITEANNSVTMETSLLDESITVPKSGRKRKKVVLDSSVVQETSELDNSMNLSRSGRKRKVVNYKALEKDEADDDTEGEMEETPKKKRSRRSKVTEDEDTPKVEKKTRGKRPKSIQSLPEEETVSCKCPKCEYQHPVASEVRRHVAMEHQLWWSKENPEGLGDRAGLRQVLKLRKFLNCTKCDKRLNHLQYYEHHMEWCGREDEVYTCEWCGSYNLKLMWKNIHKVQCSKLKADAENEKRHAKSLAKKEKSDAEKELPGGKRHAAKRALTILKDLSQGDDGAHLDISDVDDPDAVIDDKEEMDDDAEDEDDEEIDEEVDDDSPYGSDDDLPGRRARSRNAFRVKPGQVAHHHNFWVVYDLMKKYVTENHSDELFIHWLPRKQDWIALPKSESSQYLPRPSSSAQFTFGSLSKTQSLDTYQVQNTSGFPIFYTGTAVWKLAWCPTPFNKSVDQYLAIVGKGHPHDSFYTGQRSTGPGLIQLWNTGISNNARHQKSEPSLAYSIAHDYGKATEIKWCPSGCYQSGKNKTDPDAPHRLGLLAISCTDGTVRIFSLPQLSDLPACEQSPVFKPAPVVTLTPHRVPPQQESGPACTCLDWCMTKGHDKMAAGYSDGTVRLFHLSTTSPLIILQSTPDLVLTPFHRFQPLGSLVRSVCFCAQAENRLVVGSEDFETFFLNMDTWDSCPDYVDPPTAMTVNLAASLWHPGIFQGNDDNYAVGFNRSRYVEMSALSYYTMASEKGGTRKDELLSYNIASQSACIWEVSVSNWLNYVIAADNRGTMAALPLQDMTHHIPDQKLYRIRQLVFTTTLIEDDETSEDNGANSEPTATEDCSVLNSDPSAKPNSKSSQETTDSSEHDAPKVPKILPKTLAQTSGEQEVETEAGPHVATDTGETIGEKGAASTSCENKDLDFDYLKSNVILQFEEHFDNSPLGPVQDPINDNYSRFPVGGLTTVAINPNHRQCVWVAFAGHSGLVRLVNIFQALPIKMRDFLKDTDPACGKKSATFRRLHEPEDTVEEDF